MSTATDRTGVVGNKLAGVAAIAFENPGNTEMEAKTFALSPDRRLVATTDGQSIQLHTMKGEFVDSVRYTDFSSDTVRFLGWNPTSKIVVLVLDGSVYVRKLNEEGKFTAVEPEVTHQLKTSEGQVLVALSEADELMAIATNSRIEVYKLRGRDRHILLQTIDLTSDIRAISFSPDNGTLIIQCGEKLCFYHLATDQ